MKPEDLGAYYESILENEVRKEGGIYYTPPFIVDYIVKHTLGELLKGKTPKEAEKIKIVDPSCGAGVFLLSAYQFLLDWYQNQLGTLTFSQRKQILLNNIFGVDIDENAAEITKYCLSLQCFEGKSHTLDLTHNIQCGNSVVDTDFYNYEFGESVERLVKPFDWQKAFPSVFIQDGFDAVIGNPPWVSLKGKFGHSIDSNIFSYLLKKYQGNTRMPNLYEYFVHRCLTLINDTGLFSFIVPDRLGYNKQFITLRKKILDDYVIKELLYKVPFPGIIADTLIFRIGKKNIHDNGKTLLVGEYQHQLQRKSVDEYLADSEYRFQYEIDKHISSVLQKIFTNDRCAPLGSVVETTSGVGAKSSSITEKRKNQRQIEIVRGRSIQRYAKVKTFFFEFKQENITGRTVDRNKLGTKEKVLLRKTGFPIFAMYDNSGICPEQSLYFLFNNRTDNSLKYITAILNSKLFQFVYLNRLITTKDSTPYLKKVDLDRFPLYVCNAEDRQAHNLIVQYVDRLIRLSQQIKIVEREIEHYEEQIDAIIYKLYGLTAEEIAIVEESHDPH